MASLDLVAITDTFLKELQDAAQGKTASLPFIKNPLPHTSIVKNDSPFQVIVIGGSVCKNAIVRKTATGISLEFNEEEPQPPFLTEVSFLEFLESKIDPKVTVVCVNFAYPLKPEFTNNILDGILLSGSKENTFGTLVTKPVGKTIAEYLSKKRTSPLTVTVANDTVCTLLSGRGENEWDSLACGIVGTGVNFAFFSDSTTAVNLESGNFDGFQASEEMKSIDQNSSYPGTALFEKETAGAYLYQQFNIRTSQLNPTSPSLTSTKELSDLLQASPSSDTQLARELLQKSAQLIACQIAGITKYKNHAMTFVMEGSFFWESSTYKETVEKTIKLLVPDHQVDLIHVTNSPIIGGARLALS